MRKLNKINKERTVRHLFVISICLFIVSRPAFAQNPPSGQEAGPQAERFKALSEEEKARLREKEAKPAEIEVEEEREKPAVPAVSFILRDIKLSGASLFKPQDLRFIYQPYLGKTVHFQDLEDIAKKIKAAYKNKGYFTATVSIPEQDIKEGVIEFRVIEGKMGELRVENNKWFSSGLVKKFFHLKKNQILDFNVVQRDILRLNRNSDLVVKALISSGKEPETSDITLTVEDKFPWHAGLGFDNQGTRLTGKYRSYVYLRSSNLSGNADSLFVNSLLTSDSFGEFFSYTLPLGTYGTQFTLDATYFKMRLGKEFKTFEIRGDTQIYTPRLSWELALSENFEAYADLGLDIKSIRKKISGDATTDDQLRLPYFSFEFSKNDPVGQTKFSPRFTFGTENFLGASSRNHPTASRPNTGGFFFKYEQSLRRIQRMPWDSYMLLRSQFQAASHTLPSSEQLQLGGANSIRGYPEGDYLADSGGNLNLDWVLPMFLIPKDWKLPADKTALRHRIEPVLFFDLGGGKLRKVSSGEKKYKFLAGIGGGIKVSLSDKFSLRLDWAASIADEAISDCGPSTFYLSFQSEI